MFSACDALLMALWAIFYVIQNFHINWNLIKSPSKLALPSLITFSWKLGNWKASTWKTKNLIAIKLSIFTEFRWKTHRIQMKKTEIYNSIKKRLQCRCFPVSFAKFLRTPFLENTSGRLLLDFSIHLTIFCHTVTWQKSGFFYFWTCFIMAFKSDENHD